MAYELYFWPGIQGRGEFVRLALEEAGAPYVDIARERGKGQGVAAMTRLLNSESDSHIPFAPPILRDGDLVIAHVANILRHLGPKLGLVPRDESPRAFASALQLTVTDLVAEVHHTHHPISPALYYEDQKQAAKANAAAFLAHRLPKYLDYFERVLKQNPAGPAHSVGDALSYVDLSLFQLVEGLRYAFPGASTNIGAEHPHLAALAKSVKARPRIAAYLKSPRRLAFNENGIFRHYPELEPKPA
jgi:glutathione S-transferase